MNGFSSGPLGRNQFSWRTCGNRCGRLGWLGAIARNEIRDQAKFYRRQGRDVARNVPVEEAHQEALAVRSEVSRLDLAEQARALERALELLPEPYREVILLRRYEELSFREISARMGRSPDACRVLHARALAALTIEMKKMAEA